MIPIYEKGYRWPLWEKRPAGYRLLATCSKVFLLSFRFVAHISPACIVLRSFWVLTRRGSPGNPHWCPKVVDKLEWNINRHLPCEVKDASVGSFGVTWDTKTLHQPGNHIRIQRIAQRNSKRHSYLTNQLNSGMGERMKYSNKIILEKYFRLNRF